MKKYLILLVLIFSFQRSSHAQNKKLISDKNSKANILNRIEQGCLRAEFKRPKGVTQKSVCRCIRKNHSLSTAQEDLIWLADFYEKPSDQPQKIDDGLSILQSHDIDISESCLKNPSYTLKSNKQ